MIESIDHASPPAPKAPLCRALKIPRATYYRRRGARSAEAQSGTALPPAPRASYRALSGSERQQTLDALHSPRFADKAPYEVYAALLDEGLYLCSVRTMYRILAAHAEVRERRDQRRHPIYQKPELLATAPNQVWSWDITKLLGPAKWTYFCLYVILDVFSRFVVGWMVARRESQALAARLIAETIAKQRIAPGQLTLHADRGSSMKSKPVAMLLADLGVTKSHSRPHTSNDNPFSESQFKTLKYRPEFPDRFGSIEDARAFCVTFFPWYNAGHYHSGLGLLTPEMVHGGRADQAVDSRNATLLEAWGRHPERFVRGAPTAPAPPEAVWINPPERAKPPEGMHTKSEGEVSHSG